MIAVIHIGITFWVKCGNAEWNYRGLEVVVFNPQETDTWHEAQRQALRLKRKRAVTKILVVGIICFLVFAFIYWGLLPAHSQLEPTPEQQTFERIAPSEIDFELLRQQQLQDLEAAYASYCAKLDEEEAAAKAKYLSDYERTDTGWHYPGDENSLGSEEVYGLIALKKQYEAVRSAYHTQKTADVTSINQYYDLLETIQAEEATYLEVMSGITNDQGRITDVSEFKDILPTAQQYRANLQTLKATISTPPDRETAEQKAQREQAIAQIGEQVSGITSLENDYLKQEEFKNQGWLVQKWDLSAEAFKNLYRGLQTLPLWGLIGGGLFLVMVMVAAFFGERGKSFLQRLLAMRL